MSSWAVSNTELYNSHNQNSRQTEGSRSRQLIQLVWQTFAERCQKFGNFLRRESNKPLPKELRRSLRLNKSARRKGYQHYETEADKRRIEDYLNQPINISIRVGPAFHYSPTNC